MEVISIPLPPSSRGWLGGGIDCIGWAGEAAAADAALVSSSFPWELAALFSPRSLSASPDMSLANDGSFGEDCALELDNLPCESPFPPLPPRDELRGETRPTYAGHTPLVELRMDADARLARPPTCFAHRRPQLLHKSRCPLGPRRHSGVFRV